ncbi:UNVERIFIED_CONTAM: hypothetical protein FKN15_033612 [Acipenser sinensis]
MAAADPREAMAAADPWEANSGGRPTSPSYPITGGSPGNAEQQAAPGDAEQQAGGEPGPAVVLGLALFSAAATRQFSPSLCLAAYARAAADHQHLVPVRPVLKGEAAPALPPRVVVVEAKAEATLAALLLAKEAGAPPLLAAMRQGLLPFWLQRGNQQACSLCWWR